ncbi:MAG: SRPBCC family protein [Limnobacter sp.]|nr:SRPBCC family protein [Limnobacter sp.]
MPQIVMQQQFNAPVSKVFGLLSKHATFDALFWPIKSVRIQDSEDPSNADGLGSIREMGVGPLKLIREQITLVEPNQTIEYAMLKNPLVRHHLGRLEFAEQGGKTHVKYTIELESKPPLVDRLVLAQLKLTASAGLRKIAKNLR